MSTSLSRPLNEFLDTHGFFTQTLDPLFLVAYSGGGDSTALLHSLHQLRQNSHPSLRIVAATYWHPWRPLHEDLQVIHQTCQKLQLPWVMLTPNLRLPKSEASARADRYQQLSKLAFDIKASALLTAHHQDDLIETILFRLLRGTGPEGLMGIEPLRMLPIPSKQNSVPLGRPFLEVRHSEIQAYLQENGLPFVQDPTNTDQRFKRNLIRHTLLPTIESHFPQVRHSLKRLTTILDADMVILDQKVQEVWSEVFEPSKRRLRETLFLQLSRGLQRRVLRQFLAMHGFTPGFQKVEEVLGFIAGDKRSLVGPSLFSLGKTQFLMSYRAWLSIEVPSRKPFMALSVTIPGQTALPESSMMLSITPVASDAWSRSMDLTKLPPHEIYVDLSPFKGETLVLRTRQPGDRISPLGMTSPIKLKRYFMNRCIPRFERDHVLLLTKDSEVLWVVGLGLSETIRVKERPTHRITITPNVLGVKERQPEAFPSP